MTAKIELNDMELNTVSGGRHEGHEGRKDRDHDRDYDRDHDRDYDKDRHGRGCGKKIWG